MASTIVFGPYFWHVDIPVRGAHNFSIGPDSRLDAPVVHATAQPLSERRQSQYALWLSDMSVMNVDRGIGDIDRKEITVFATFANSGLETVKRYNAYFSVTRE